ADRDLHTVPTRRSSDLGDDESDVAVMVDKLTGMRLFDDEAGKMNLSIGQAGGEFLVVSQFTLYDDVRKGRRPSFTDAAPPEAARDRKSTRLNSSHVKIS